MSADYQGRSHGQDPVKFRWGLRLESLLHQRKSCFAAFNEHYDEGVQHHNRQPRMFATPRPKKSLLPPQTKKRKRVHSIEEITFDKDARTEYLTGFRKRKQARIKHAQDVAKEKARLEKIEMRKQVWLHLYYGLQPGRPG